MSNGITKISIGDKTIQLTFGMMSVEEIGNRQATGVSGWFKLITDIIYGGYVNDQYLEGKAPELSYRQVAEMVDSLLTNEDSQLANVFTVFQGSKAGKMIEEAVKKKAAEKSKSLEPEQPEQTGMK